MKNDCRITRLRLVNFHNLGTTTLEVKGGGHLFLLGDNGSGKTTLLDAVHFVLTGGRAMEFNSAARVAGARQSAGRNVQGIIMRYNIETNGPLNPAGGITYAALEIVAPNGRIHSLAVGVGARSMDEAYESWGAVTDGGIEDLPLLIEQEGRRRPATRHELRKALDGRGYYGRIGAYTDEVATRFFGGRATYEDACQLLATGKAYREIAARAGDYDRLFRTLLQEPRKEVFESLIRSLKSIEESRHTLEGLRVKVAYVEALDKLRAAVHTERLTGICALWQERTVQADALRMELATASQMLAGEKTRVEELEQRAETLRLKVEHAQLALNELRAKDDQSLVVREKEARLAGDRARQRHHQARETLRKAKAAQSAAEKRHKEALEALLRQMGSSANEVRSLGASLEFSTTALSAFLEEACHAERPEGLIPELPGGQLLRTADEHTKEVARRIVAASAHLTELKQLSQELEEQLREKRRQNEAEPGIPGFAAARRALKEALSPARPLYEGLVAAARLRSREIAMLEQLIGDATLATWITKPEDGDNLRQIIFKEFPGHTLAVPEAPDDTRCDWLGRYFDISASDPDALIVLRQQLEARHGPHAGKFLDHQVLHFRGRERVATLAAPRLIGLETRRAQLQREIQQLEQEQSNQARRRRTLAKDLATLEATQERIDQLKNLLHALPGLLQRLANAVHQTRNEHATCETLHAAEARELIRCEEEAQLAEQTHNDILLRLKRDGLEGLNKRIGEAERKVTAVQRELRQCDNQIGAVHESLKNLAQRQQEQMAALAEVLARRDQAEATLLGLETPQQPVNEFVAARCGAAADQEALRLLAEESRLTAARHEATLASALKQNDNLAFGFIYEETDNKVADRRGAHLETVIEETRSQLAEQESLITEETRQLFKQIVMDELVTALQTHVLQLQQMTRKIGALLRHRDFGNNRYAFSATPTTGYAAIVETVRNYHSLAPGESEGELKTFIDTHLDQILATEVGEIPPVLDYRNWFRYELKIMTAGAGDRVIDRRVKSLGSGGEQAVPNYLLILMIANFLYDRERMRLPVLIFDEAFYGIDAARRDQIIAFATDLRLQLFVASPDQDGVKKEVPRSTSVLVIKDTNFNVHLYTVHWDSTLRQESLFEERSDGASLEFS